MNFISRDSLFNYFLLSVFLFMYGLYAHTLLFSFIFGLIAIGIVIYYHLDLKLEECNQKLKNQSMQRLR
jgi:hypothetical protein